MQKVYKFSAKPQAGNVFSGKVYAPGEDEAKLKLQRQGLKIIDISIHFSDTVDLIFRKEPDGRELAQFYKTLSRRMANGGGLEQSLEESQEFTLDTVLAVIVAMMIVAAKNGATIEDCMEFSGLPVRDVSVVKALRQAGDASRGLNDLSVEYRQAYILRKKLKAVFLEPVLTLGLSYFMIWGIFYFAVPRIQKFYSQLPNAKLPAYVQSLYAFVDKFDAHIFVSSALYIALVPAIFVLLKSPIWGYFRDKIPTLRALSERSDHAMIWSSYALLYEAAMNRADAAEMIAKSAKRADSRMALINMAMAMRNGLEPARAVAISGFPKFAHSSVSNSLRSGSANDVTEGLRLFSGNLAEDVELLSERITTYAKFAMYILMGLIVTGVAMITAVPMIQTALHQV
ncbi:MULTISPECIES: type II secretion system F family protein [Acidithiobacillus]|uniref:Type II secretion system protein GspF domain-containing protein n=2 Tax=Acidithiobacillus TaxID=119977 RepID=A0A179BNH7_ACIFR|nr:MULTISPECIES: type II secretion system F family protein [Acidithiobacillus]MEB8488125.1 type II secretion system F family protein [Acidithiobacillus ferriphilus]MEB8488711.1 type II secretion system F family protein [Acidithiobacillus ferriphilus]MEB8492155.1 type II secretion system F family protein [Acidithiobacillus ferriphilus]MEB8513459.1 type II secretion system F family protein [Acidithiobacillus ferriphilus]MEB8520354.1 type II secretion system F family protein [Acidithiobacillus fe